MSTGRAAERAQRSGTAFFELQVHLHAGGVATAGMSELIKTGPIFPGRPLLFALQPWAAERAHAVESEVLSGSGAEGGAGEEKGFWWPSLRADPCLLNAPFETF